MARMAMAEFSIKNKMTKENMNFKQQISNSMMSYEMTWYTFLVQVDDDSTAHTESDSDKASQLADILLIKKVVACISFNKIESRFWWEGKLEHSNEVQLIIKTNKDNLKMVLNEIKQNHSYQNPELIFWMASFPYLLQ